MVLSSSARFYKAASLSLSVREWCCEFCAAHHDRDVNAAKNLEIMAVSSTVSARGASSGGTASNDAVSHLDERMTQ